jgi:transposase-like protein
MEQIKRSRRIFSPQQKYEMLKDVERYPTLKEGLAKYDLDYSVYRRWRRQLQVGVHASLRNGRPVRSPEVKLLQAENRRLKEALLNQSLHLAELKKEMNLDSPLPGESDFFKPSARRSSASSRMRS